MSLAAMIFACLSGAILVLIAAALLSPLVFVVDSRKWQLRVRWMSMLDYWRPLPGKAGETGMSIGGIRVQPAAKAERTQRPEQERPAHRPSKDRLKVARFALGCLRRTAIRRSLTAGLWRFGRRLRHSASLTERYVEISLPDPAWNAGGLGRGDALEFGYGG